MSAQQDSALSERRSYAQRVWLALSIANVWACGVATAQHDWSAVLCAVFFAVTCWGLSSKPVRLWWETL